MMKNYLCAMFLTVILPFQLISQKKVTKELDAYFERAMQDWEVPGMEVLIIKDGEVVLEKGYGVKNTETNDPVTPNSLMAIASNTKAFTSAALAMLVDEGKISWDDKVIDYLPYFRLYDAHVTQEFTIKDLLCHRSGLATFSGDLLWYGTSHSREEVIKRAQYLKPVFGFRDGYGYQNIMYLAAGEVVAVASGMSWDAFIQERFFKPLGMNQSVTSVTELSAEKDVSSPHNYKFKKQIPIEWVNWDNVSSAGSIVSCVSDMKHWIKAQLNNGIYDQDTMWSDARTHEMRTVVTPKSISSWSSQHFPSKTFSGYGLGWDIFNYHGKKVINHGGGYDGFISRVAMVPEEGLGVVILTNTNTWLPSPLMYQILDAYLCDDKKKTDWSGFFLDLKNEVEAHDELEKEAAEENRVKNTVPSLALDNYAGVYRSEMYGDLSLRVIGDQIAFQFEPTSIFRGDVETLAL